MTLACGSTTGSEDDGAGTTTGGTDTTTTASTTATTTASTTDTTTVGTTDTTTVSTTDTTATATTDTGTVDSTDTGSLGCGDVPCDGNSYCDWVANTCGLERWDEVACTPQPAECEPGRPVCGCDGQVYDGECGAAGVGVDVSQDGGCEPPKGTFGCGWNFCDLASSYCQHTVSDVLPSPDGWSCPALPEACGDTPSCDCLVDEPCADFGCEIAEGGGLVITCPGG